ncbi:hypothetical protein [Ulvibacter antarcticus]|nr:hypothetical protein [Ulvibacter antarcticus]
MDKATSRQFRSLSLMIICFLIFSISYGQQQKDTKVGPVKTAKLNFKELAKDPKSLTDSIKKKKPQNEVRIPENLRLPPGADIKRHDAPPRDSLTLKIKKKEKVGNDDINPNFPGLGDNNTSIPPDIGGAVGPNHLMVALNTQVRIQDKNGLTMSTVGLDAFFSSLGGSPNMFDPKVLYDPFNSRWMITAVANGQSANSALMVGVSDTNDPTGIWSLYQFDPDSSNTNWFDYPSIGFNKNWIVVTGNMFAVSTNAFGNSIVYMFDKLALYGGSATPTVSNRPSTEGGASCPSITLDNSEETEHLVSSWNGSSGIIRLYTITGTPSTPNYAATLLFPAAATNWSDIPAGGADFAPQSTVSNLISNGDSRVQNAVFRNGSLWCAQTIFLPSGGSPTRSGVQWWQIDPVTGTVVQNEKIQDATGTNFFAYPTLAINAYDDLLIGYSSFSAAQFASANYSIRLNSDPLSTTQGSIQFKAGLAKYFKIFSGSSNRWGDYSSSCIDPDDFSLWTIQQYAESPSGGSDRWGTEWNKWVPPVADLYSKDLAGDVGAEPNPLTGNMWQSPDIWVRKSQDIPPYTFAHVHENAEYRTGTSNPNYVYVEVHNRGSIMSSGTEQITLYWAKPGAGLGWMDPWNGGIYFDPGPNTMLMGDVVSSQTIPPIPANSSEIFEFPWNPPNPASYATAFGTNTNHFCLLSRITTSGSAPFGMTFPETGSLNGNVRNNNNIVWKNIGVYDLLPGTMSPAQAVISNMTNLGMNAKFTFDLIDENGVAMSFENGHIQLKPIGKLAETFKENPPRGYGISINEDGTINISKKGAFIENVNLEPNEFGIMDISYVPDNSKELGKGYAINFTQLAKVNNDNETVIGGQTFVYGKVAGFQTEPDGNKGWHCPIWCWMIIILIILFILWIVRRKRN